MRKLTIACLLIFNFGCGDSKSSKDPISLDAIEESLVGVYLTLPDRSLLAAENPDVYELINGYFLKVASNPADCDQQSYLERMGKYQDNHQLAIALQADCDSTIQFDVGRSETYSIIEQLSLDKVFYRGTTTVAKGEAPSGDLAEAAGFSLELQPDGEEAGFSYSTFGQNQNSEEKATSTRNNDGDDNDNSDSEDQGNDNDDDDDDDDKKDKNKDKDKDKKDKDKDKDKDKNKGK